MFGVDVVGESGRRCKPSKMGLARCRPWNFPDPIHEPLKIDGNCGGQMMKMGLLQAPIPRPPHSQGKSSLRHRPFDAGSPFVGFNWLRVLDTTERS
jgi:hypothetical protein